MKRRQGEGKPAKTRNRVEEHRGPKSALWLNAHPKDSKTLSGLIEMFQDLGAQSVLSIWLGSYFTEAVTHTSWVKEHPKARCKDNEILEFVGDSVLALAMSVILIERFPRKTEGELSLMRHQLVNNQQLALFAEQLDFGSCLRLGKGEEQSGGRKRERMLANA